MSSKATANTDGRARARASAACQACRSRRTKSVIPDGESTCDFCKSNDRGCVLVKDDMRKQRISQDYVTSLESRIQLLEATLQGYELGNPPTNVPPDFSTNIEEALGFREDASLFEQVHFQPDPATSDSYGGDPQLSSGYDPCETLIPFWQPRRLSTNNHTNSANDDQSSNTFLEMCLRAVSARFPSTNQASNAWPNEDYHTASRDFFDTGKAKSEDTAVVHGLILLADLEFRVGKTESSYNYFQRALDIFAELSDLQCHGFPANLIDLTFSSLVMYSQSVWLFLCPS